MDQAGRSDEQRVKEVYPRATRYVFDGGCCILPKPSVAYFERISGWFDVESSAWADAALRLPEGESKRHDEVTADDEPEIFALLNLHRANVEASSSPEAKQAFMDTMRFLLELAKVRHAAKVATPAPEAAPQTFEEWWDEARRLFFPDIADGVELTRIKNGALAGWNAAKASSPAAKKEHEPLEWGTNCPQAPDRGPHECAGNDATCVHSGKQGHVCLRCGCYCLCQWCNEGNLRIRSSVSERLVHTDTPVGRVACIDQPSSPAVAGRESET